MAAQAEEKPTQKGPLFSLPAELRDYIITLAVSEQEPIPAYISKRTVRRKQCQHQKYNQDNNTHHDCNRLVHEYSISPRLPALALVSVHTYNEVSAIFYRENALVFCEPGVGEHARWCEVRDWFGQVIKYYRAPRERNDPFYPVPQQDAIALNVKTIITEFMVPSCDTSSPSECHADVKVEYDIDGRITARWGGALSSRCICALQRQVDYFNESAWSTNAWKLFTFQIRVLEQFFGGLDIVPNSATTAICTSCGKPGGGMFGEL
jgi:hypothetical protein